MAPSKDFQQRGDWDYSTLRGDAAMRAEEAVSLGDFTSADLKYLRLQSDRDACYFRDAESEELRCVCRACLQVWVEPAAPPDEMADLVKQINQESATRMHLS